MDKWAEREAHRRALISIPEDFSNALELTFGQVTQKKKKDSNNKEKKEKNTWGCGRTEFYSFFS